MKNRSLVITLISILLPFLLNSVAAITFEEKPIAIEYTQDSILNQNEHNPLAFATTERKRLATCSGVAWFHDNYLATVNLLGEKLYIYRFDKDTNTVTLLQTLSTQNGIGYPINLDFSTDGTLLAISNARGYLSIHRVNLDTHHIDSQPLIIAKDPTDINTHGVRFCPNSQFLAYATIDKGWIRFFKVDKNENNNVDLINLYSMPCPFLPSKPKGIDFSPCGHYAVVCYFANAGVVGKTTSILAIYPFDQDNGQIADKAISLIKNDEYLSGPEDVIFSHDGSYLIVSNQANDTLVLYGFDKSTGKIGEGKTILKNPEAQLSFPHGCSLSQDGNYLAVSNLGDDKFTIYKIEKN